MTAYDTLRQRLCKRPCRWVITGVGGFIGSHLLEALLALDQNVAGMDNLSSGSRKNLDSVRQSVSPRQWARFTFVKGDIRQPDACRELCKKADYILHQAALVSVPRSFEEPLVCNEINVDGFLNILLAAREARVKRLVYASSSALYGDSVEQPKREDRLGRMLSPYAVSKRANELYADVLSGDLSTAGLRYFNVFGPRQDPNGAYAAVIPQWIASIIERGIVHVNGDGETTRDFCHVHNVVQANLLAATQPLPSHNPVYNVAEGRQTSLNELFVILRRELAGLAPRLAQSEAVHGPFREGDVRRSEADISRIQAELGYSPSTAFEEGIRNTVGWYYHLLSTKKKKSRPKLPRAARKDRS